MEITNDNYFKWKRHNESEDLGNKILWKNVEYELLQLEQIDNWLLKRLVQGT